MSNLLNHINVYVDGIISVLKKMRDLINNNTNNSTKILDVKNSIMILIEYIEKCTQFYSYRHLSSIAFIDDSIRKIPSSISDDVADEKQYQKLHAELMNLLKFDPDVKNDYWKFVRKSIRINVTKETIAIEEMFGAIEFAMGEQKTHSMECTKESLIDYSDDPAQIPKNYEDSDDNFTKLTKNGEYLMGVRECIIAMGHKVKSIRSVRMLYDLIQEIPDNIQCQSDVKDNEQAVDRYQEFYKILMDKNADIDE